MSPPLQLVIADDYDEMSRRAAGLMIDTLDPLAAPNIVLPTGNTPLGLYQALAANAQAGLIDLSRAHCFQLDEYAGLAPDDKRLLHGWLKRSILDPLAISNGAMTRFNSATDDPAGEAENMEQMIEAAGGIDLQVLGLGPNGHIGFNEPGSAPDSSSRMVELTAESISSNAVYWGDESLVPRKAFTLGLGVLSCARRTLLLVSGAAKSEILSATLEGPVTPMVPATFLRLIDGVTVIADRSAAAAIRSSANKKTLD
jgi:glucosamine-6-phosphate deaminase